VRGERVAEARLALEELHTRQRREQAELVRSTAALEAAVWLGLGLGLGLGLTLTRVRVRVRVNPNPNP